MQSDFNKYLQSETKKISIGVLIGMAVLSVITAIIFLKYTKEGGPVNA